MPNQPISENAPSRSILEQNTQVLEVYAQVIDLVEERHNQITLIKQLLQLVHAVQLHRGMSMSLLAGGKTFANDIKDLQNNLELRLALIGRLMEHNAVPLSSHDKENLHNAWHTIRHDWEGDKLLDNFELHSHYIAQLNELIKDMSLGIAKPLAELIDEKSDNSSGGGEFGYPPLFKNIELLNFISHQLPTMIELFGKLRGLASYAATRGQAESQHESKIRFLLADAKEQHEKTRLQAKRIQEIWPGQLTSISQVANIELKVLYMFTTIEREILGHQSISIEAHQFFKLATEIIDTYGEIGEDGWTLTRRQVDRDLETWVSHQGKTPQLQ